MTESESDARACVQRWVEDYGQVLFAFAYRWTSDQQSADDIVQSVFLRALRHFAKVQAAENQRSYLLMMTRNEAIRYGQRRCVTKEDWSQQSDPSPGGEHRLEQVDCIQNSLAKLSEDHRRILLMFYFEEASYQEIAEACAIPMGTVMSRLARAKESLRRHVIESERQAPLAKETRS